MRECKSLLQRLEDSVERKLQNLGSATFSSQVGLSVHASGMNVDLREMETQISDLRSHAILTNDPKALSDGEHWQKKHDALVSRVHEELLQAKKKLGRRQLLMGRGSSLKNQMDEDLVSHMKRLESTLQVSVERSVNANQKLEQGTSGLRNISTQYKDFDQVVDSSKRLIQKYAKKEEREWRYFMAALFFFYAVVAYILYSRMPLLKSLLIPILKRSFNAILSLRHRQQVGGDHLNRPEL